MPFGMYSETLTRLSASGVVVALYNIETMRMTIEHLRERAEHLLDYLLVI
jgi:hypothetical protein